MGCPLPAAVCTARGGLLCPPIRAHSLSTLRLKMFDPLSPSKGVSLLRIQAWMCARRRPRRAAPDGTAAPDGIAALVAAGHSTAADSSKTHITGSRRPAEERRNSQTHASQSHAAPAAVAERIRGRGHGRASSIRSNIRSHAVARIYWCRLRRSNAPGCGAACPWPAVRFQPRPLARQWHAGRR